MNHKLLFLFYLIVVTPLLAQQRFVLAIDGLNLRGSPNGKVLATIPYGATVTITGSRRGSISISGYSGSWVPIRWAERDGYVFDGFLSPLPVPRQPCPNLPAYSKQLRVETKQVYYIVQRWNFKTNSEEEIARSTVAIPNPDPEHGVYVTRTEYTTAEGLTFIYDVSDEAITHSLKGKDLGIQLLYLITLACMPPEPRRFFSNFADFRTHKNARCYSPVPMASGSVLQLEASGALSFSESPMSCANHLN